MLSFKIQKEVKKGSGRRTACFDMRKKIKRVLFALCAVLSACLMAGCAKKDEEVQVGPNGDPYCIEESELTKGIFIRRGQGEKALYYPPLNPVQGVSKDGQAGSHIWFTRYDKAIPEFRKGDALVLYSPDALPESLRFWRLEDLGYTVGVKFEKDPDTKEITFPSGAEGYCPYSVVGKVVLEGKFKDAQSLANVRVREINGNAFKASTLLNEQGFVLRLTKDAMYEFGFYAGTVWDTLRLKADSHVFLYSYDMETRSYMELKEKVFEVRLPDGMENGYWYIEGIGIMNYKAASEDLLTRKPEVPLTEDAKNAAPA